MTKLSQAQHRLAHATKGTKNGHQRATVKAMNEQLERENPKPQKWIYLAVTCVSNLTGYIK